VKAGSGSPLIIVPATVSLIRQWLPLTYALSKAAMWTDASSRTNMPYKCLSLNLMCSFIHWGKSSKRNIITRVHRSTFPATSACQSTTTSCTMISSNKSCESTSKRSSSRSSHIPTTSRPNRRHSNGSIGSSVISWGRSCELEKLINLMYPWCCRSSTYSTINIYSSVIISPGP